MENIAVIFAIVLISLVICFFIYSGARDHIETKQFYATYEHIKEEIYPCNKEDCTLRRLWKLVYICGDSNEVQYIGITPNENEKGLANGVYAIMVRYLICKHFKKIDNSRGLDMTMRLFCDECQRELEGEEYDIKVAQISSSGKIYCDACDKKIMAYQVYCANRKRELEDKVEEQYQHDISAMHDRIFDGIDKGQGPKCLFCGRNR